MATKVTMPQMGFDMTEGKVARWLKKVGEAVKQGEPVAEIETDKVNIETEAFGNGVLREILASEGSTVPVGTLIGIIAEPNEDISSLIAESGKSSAPVAAASTVRAAAPSAAQVAAKGNGRLKASPLAKRIAQDRGINLSEVAGSGPGGRIVKRDLAAAATSPIAMPAAPRTTVVPTLLAAPVLKDEDVTPSKLRQTIT
ncbi:MAG TPA: biotin/lipoyl-containing protein, partial [Anaerolineae bacterium]|nr:biotin/lipoyl-containing protein [Anaerolineae bacterium]